MATESSPMVDNTEVFQRLDSYPWDKDTEFQGGLSAILGNTTDPKQIQELTLRAQCFYLSRKKSISIDFDAYRTYLSKKTSSSTQNISSTQSTTMDNQAYPRKTPPQGPQAEPTTTSSQPQDQTSHKQTHTLPLPPPSDPKTAPYPPTFAEIVALITSGAPIPGIVDIPPTLLPISQAAAPAIPKRRKPWETDVPEAVLQGAGSVIGEGEEGLLKVEGTFGDRRDEIVVQELPEKSA